MKRIDKATGKTVQSSAGQGAFALLVSCALLAATPAFASEPVFRVSREAQVRRSGDLPAKQDSFALPVAGKTLVIDAAGNLKGTSGLRLEAKELEIFFITDIQYAALADRTVLSVDFSNGDYVVGAFYVLANTLDKAPELAGYSTRLKAGQFATDGRYAFEATHESYRLLDLDAKKAVYERKAGVSGDLRYDTRISLEGAGTARVSYYRYEGSDRKNETALVEIMTGKER